MMNALQFWLYFGVTLVLLEFVLPGGIVVFLGLAAFIVAFSLYMSWITSVPMALITWFISSIALMLFLRSLFIRYFEGDTSVQNVDEDEDLKGLMVEVVEDIQPYKEGRVRLRDATWMARSDSKINVGSQALVIGRDGNRLIVKPL